MLESIFIFLAALAVLKVCGCLKTETNNHSPWNFCFASWNGYTGCCIEHESTKLNGQFAKSLRCRLTRAFWTASVVFIFLFAVEKWFCERLCEDFCLPWDTGRVPWFGCSGHDQNSQGETDVTSGYLPQYKVFSNA